MKKWILITMSLFFVLPLLGKKNLPDSMLYLKDKSITKALPKRFNAELFLKDEQWGVRSLEGSEIVAPEYDSIYPLLLAHYYVLKQNGRYGVADTTGRILLPLGVDSVYNLQLDMLAQLWQSRKISMKYVYPELYAESDILNNFGHLFLRSDFFLFNTGRNKGAGNANGVIIDFCDEIIPVENHLVVFKSQYYFLINEKGENTTESYYQNVLIEYNDRRIIVTQKGKNGIIDFTGKVILNSEYKSIKLIDKSFLVEKEDYEVGFFDLKGNLISNRFYKTVFMTGGGKYAQVYDDNNICGLIDLNKHILCVPIKYDKIEMQPRGTKYAIVQKHRQLGIYSLIDNKIVLSIKYAQIEPSGGENSFYVYRRGKKKEFNCYSKTLKRI